MNDDYLILIAIIIPSLSMVIVSLWEKLERYKEKNKRYNSEGKVI